MRKQRIIRKRSRRNKPKVFDIDITSLLDILVIMLVFLLKSYNSSGIVINVPKGVTLPTSESVKLSTTGVMVQVSTSNIWVDDKMIVDSKNRSSTLYDHGGRRIIPLYNELIRKKELIKRTSKSSPNAVKFSGIANLIVDKSIRYTYIKKLMYTCAEAGFQKYKFVVLGSE